MNLIKYIIYKVELAIYDYNRFKTRQVYLDAAKLRQEQREEFARALAYKSKVEFTAQGTIQELADKNKELDEKDNRNSLN